MNRIIVLSVATVAILTFSGCGNSDKATEATKQATTEVATATKDATSKTADVAKEAASKAVEATKEAAANVAEKAKETATKATEAVKETAEKAVDATKEVATNVADKAKETAEKAVEATKEAAANVAEKAKTAVAGGNDKGASLYAKCKSCHGGDGKTKALGKSEVIAGQNADELAKKLTEYKAGTRNVAGMGTLMKGQVAPMSDEDIKALATYISNLK